mmetsp:Transcript_11518/g.22658  ORF Transcript_11518/g.22658 Transcript_11518/m.22658 type:complete len:98 (+) Transcript_11518:123-416(+)
MQITCKKKSTLSIKQQPETDGERAESLAQKQLQNRCQRAQLDSNQFTNACKAVRAKARILAIWKQTNKTNSTCIYTKYFLAVLNEINRAMVIGVCTR